LSPGGAKRKSWEPRRRFTSIAHLRFPKQTEQAREFKQSDLDAVANLLDINILGLGPTLEALKIIA
jgi:hypothetical protein